MSANITKYTLATIEDISKSFNGTLNKNIIDMLLQIKKNGCFLKYTKPINVQYTDFTANTDNNQQNISLFKKKVVSYLNKLTSVNFTKMLSLIKTLLDDTKSLDIDYKLLVDIIFEKAIEENIYSAIYAKLLYKLIEDESSIAELTVYIETKSKDYYTTGISISKKTTEDTDYEILCQNNKEKRAILNGIVFISNLFNFSLVPYDFVHAYFSSLNEIIEELEEISEIGLYLDTMCAVMNTCGLYLKKHDPEDFHDNFLASLSILSKDKKRVSTKYRFKLMDTIDALTK